MKKLFLCFIALLLTSSVTATTIQQENVTIDLEENSVDVFVEVRELTSSTFTYITSYRVTENSLTAQSTDEVLDCNLRQLQVGSEITCHPPKKENFSVTLNFSGQGFVTPQETISVFRYSQSIYRPTKQYNMKVLLPAGTGLLNQQNASTPIVSPGNYDVGSDGRRIFIEWNTHPQLGETLNFRVMYEPFTNPIDYIKIFAAVALILGLTGVGYVVWKRKTRQNIETVYEDLSDDQIAVIELLRDSGGSMLQKDVVNQSEYSKAKISGVVSELVEKDIIEKQKEGRSNKLTISKIYSR